MSRTVMALSVIAAAGAMAWSDASVSSREALQPFNEIIGAWKGTGIPQGSRLEQQRGFWIETMNWEWSFKDADAAIAIAFGDGKYFRDGILRYQPDSKDYQLKLRTVDGQRQVFTGEFDKRVLTLTRETPEETQRLTVRLLHETRFLYSYAIRPKSKTLFAPVYQVGATRKDAAFAQGSGQPECIVTGGLGTMAVTYQGKTYYVCCTGCRDEFQENPLTYIKEFEAKQKAK